MNKRVAVLAGAIALSVIPLTAQAQTDGAPAQMAAAECDAHHETMGQPGHIGDMATMMGGQHIADMAQMGHIGHMASMYGQSTAAPNRGPRA